jgi:Family of unknown function (DUF5946)
MSSTKDPCPSCGAPGVGGVDGCQALFDRLSARLSTGLGPPYTVRRLAVDAYCLQHPDRYCVSAKSLAAHLTGLGWAMEFSGGESGLKALQAWLNGPVQPDKPPLPASFGRLTVVDVEEGDSEVASIDRWARSTWEAYADLYEIARRWIRQGTGRQ